MMEFQVGMNRSLVAQGYPFGGDASFVLGLFFRLEVFNLYFPGKPGEAGPFSDYDWKHVYNTPYIQ